MGRQMDELRDMLCEELDKIAEKGELTAGSLDTVDKLTHSIKSLDTIMAMEGYSEEGRSYDGGSYRSYARGRGRDRNYSQRNSRNSYRGGYSMDDNVVEQLEDMMEEAQDQKVRMALQKAIHKIDAQ